MKISPLGPRLALFLLALLVAAAAQPLSPDLFRELHWRNIGPFRGGRTRAAAGVPSQPNVFYMGQVNGGVWKTDDYGQTWAPIFDAQPTQSIGAIAVAPSNSNIIYVASGEGLRRPDLSVGDGIYRSADAGATWTHRGLRDGQQIPTLAIDPRNPDRLFAAVLGHPYGANPERGIFRSTDGGATWEKSLYVDADTGGWDVCFDPVNPDVMYATLWETRLGPWDGGNHYKGTKGGLFKSTDGGQNWRKLTQGLPADVSQINVGVATSDPRRIYAAVGTLQSAAIYRSDDAGDHWQLATSDPRPALAIGGGDGAMLRVDPQNPDVVYTATVVAWRSTDGAKTWSAFKGAPGGDDYQNLWINPQHPEIILLVSDQGAVVTVNGGRTWSSWYNQPTAQLYHVAADNAFPYRVYSGQQESGSVGIASRGRNGAITFRDWQTVGASEYGYVAPDPLDSNLVYGAGRLEVTKFHWDTGQVELVSPVPLATRQFRAVRTQPLMFSPVDSQVLYYAANVLFQTADGGHSWQQISPDLARPQANIPANLGELPPKEAAAAEKQRGVIYALAPSPLQLSTLWAGTDDGLVWLTTDGGKQWNNVTPPALTPWSKVTQIDASRFDVATAYISVSRFRIDDLTPYIYRTRDAGKTWQLITAGLGLAPVNAVRADPVRPGLLFAATEKAVWFSLNDGEAWQPLQLNLPATSMRDVIVKGSDLVVATHGRSFWILDDITPLRQIDAVPPTATVLFKPTEAIRVRDNLNTDTPLPPDEPTGENPPDGAILNYYLAQPAAGPVALEILDAKGQVVRRYSSADAPEVTAADLAKLPIPPYWPQLPPTLSASAGLHRWVWDLHHTAPDSLRHTYPIAAVRHRTPRLPLGPAALPGEYQVKLTVGGHVSTQPLTLRMDPRVKSSPASWEKQFATQSQLAAIINDATKAIRRGQSLVEQINEITTAPARLASAIADLKARVRQQIDSGAAPAETADAPTLIGTVNEAAELYGTLFTADATPTEAHSKAADKLTHELHEAMTLWEHIFAKDLPALNQQLTAAALPELKPNAGPKHPDEAEEADLD
ncbi:MAG: glycoside hydrolase [Opitutae bacterium]